MWRYQEAEPDEDSLRRRAVSGREKGRHSAHGFHACKAWVVFHRLGQVVGRGGYPSAKLHRGTDDRSVCRHGGHVLVPEVQQEHFRAGRDLAVLHGERVFRDSDADAEDTFRVIPELEYSCPFSFEPINGADQGSHDSAQYIGSARAVNRENRAERAFTAQTRKGEKRTMAREIVFIADDFGVSDRVNEAILHAHREGALTGACLMLGQAGSRGAVSLARECRSLEVGWHLHLTDSRPLTRSEWPWGRSPARAGFAIGLSSRMRTLARREIECQWEAFQETGLPCRFVNAHHHLHVHPWVRKVLMETLPEDFEGWVRWGRPSFFTPSRVEVFYRMLDSLFQARHRSRIPFRLSTSLWGIDRTFNMKAEEILGVLPALGEGLHEFMFHPRQVEGDPDTRALLELSGHV